MDKTSIKEIIQHTILNAGLGDKFDSLQISGLKDEPGYHWSNPGVKKIKVKIKDKMHEFVLKNLHDHSKKEALVYRFLNKIDDFPIPKLYHSKYDENEKHYWIITELCVVKEFGDFSFFWKEIGQLLAKIHYPFWEKTDKLPECFKVNKNTDQFIDSVNGFLQFYRSLSEDQIKKIDSLFDSKFSKFVKTIKQVSFDKLPKISETEKCLIHGSFHPPEIAWRKQNGEFVQIGVDWERSRIGIPEEDLQCVVGQLLSENKISETNDLVKVYLEEMTKYGINFNYDSFFASVKKHACFQVIRSELPFLIGQYLRFEKDSKFHNWLAWAKEVIPGRLDFSRNEIIKYCV